MTLVVAIFLTVPLDADARKGGWARNVGTRTDAAEADSGSGARRGLFRRASKPASVASRAQPASQRTSALRSAPRPVASPPAPASAPTSSREITSHAPERPGLLARVFGARSERQAAARARSDRALSRIDPEPPKPQLAPGQPNARQSAPVIDHALIASSSKSQSSVVINIARQRAYVYVGGKVAIDTPVSTARSGKYTPRGSFRIGERVQQGKISNLYHVEMPYWMRLGSTPFGMHAGYLPGYPASAGCIRMPYNAAAAVYRATGYGTSVKIVGG